MTTSYVGSAFAEADNVTLPTHQVGDLIIVMAYRVSTTVVQTIPAGWTRLMTRNQSSRCAEHAFKIATSSSEVSGTWTNAEFVAVGVWRDSVNYLIPGSINGIGSAASTTINYPSIDTVSTQRQRASSWVTGFVGCAINSTTTETAPTGMTNRGSLAGASIGEVAIHDSNGNTTWSSAVTVAISSAAYQSLVLELWDSGISKSSSGLSPTLINSQALARGIVI